MALKPCAEPGCPAVVKSPQRFCERHQRERWSRAKRRFRAQGRDRFGRFYGSLEWKEARKAFLEAHPLCQRCYALGVLTPAEHVHHIRRLADGGDSDWDNLMALCSDCHVRLERGRSSHEGQKAKNP